MTLPRELPKSIQAPKDPQRLLDGFIKQLGGLLAVDLVLIRETAKEALGSELSHGAHGILSEYLDK